MRGGTGKHVAREDFVTFTDQYMDLLLDRLSQYVRNYTNTWFVTYVVDTWVKIDMNDRNHNRVDNVRRSLPIGMGGPYSINFEFLGVEDRISKLEQIATKSLKSSSVYSQFILSMQYLPISVFEMLEKYASNQGPWKSALEIFFAYNQENARRSESSPECRVSVEHITEWYTLFRENNLDYSRGIPSGLLRLNDNVFRVFVVQRRLTRLRTTGYESW